MQASRTSLFRYTTLLVVTSSIVISASRILALGHYYHAPLNVVFQFETYELPRLLNVTGLLDIPESVDGHNDDTQPRIDLSLIKQFGLRLCLGKEWYRFPGHYLIPDGVDVRFIKSDFDGLLPRRFDVSTGESGFWKREATRHVPIGLNDLNKEEKSHHVGLRLCPFLLLCSMASRWTSLPATILLTPISHSIHIRLLMSRATLLIPRHGITSIVHLSLIHVIPRS